MSQNTKCHFGDGEVSGTPCPNGEIFEVRHLQDYGGERVCPNPICPHQVARVKGSVHVVVVGKSGEAGQTIVMKR